MSAEGRIVRAGERRRKDLRYGRGTVHQIVDATLGAEHVDLHVNVLRAGSAPGPYHLHTTAENVYLVLSGSVVVRIGTTDTRLEPGDAAFIPAGVAHSATNAGEGDAELIEIYAPAAVDFVEVADPATPGEETTHG